jgi:hypothetical protein
MNVPLPTKKTMIRQHFMIYMLDFFSDYDNKEAPYLNGRFRKLKFNAYVNRQKSESRFMERFKEKFGAAHRTSVILGDWSKNHTLRGHVCLYLF